MENFRENPEAKSELLQIRPELDALKLLESSLSNQESKFSKLLKEKFTEEEITELSELLHNAHYELTGEIPEVRQEDKEYFD